MKLFIYAGLILFSLNSYADKVSMLVNLNYSKDCQQSESDECVSDSIMSEFNSIELDQSGFGSVNFKSQTEDKEISLTSSVQVNRDDEFCFLELKVAWEKDGAVEEEQELFSCDQVKDGKESQLRSIIEDKGSDHRVTLKIRNFIN